MDLKPIYIIDDENECKSILRAIKKSKNSKNKDGGSVKSVELHGEELE